MSVKCGAYVRPKNFVPPGRNSGYDYFFKAEAWPYWANAEQVKREVRLYFNAAERLLSSSEYSYFYGKFLRMESDFDKEWYAVKRYSDTATFWCKYITRGIQWDTQFRLLRQEMKDSILTAQKQRTYEAEQAARSTAATTTTTTTTTSTPAASTSTPAATKTADKATPTEKKAAAAKAKVEVKKESTRAKKSTRKKKTKAAVEAAGGNTEAAAKELAKSGETAGTIGGPSPLDIALWVGGGVLALGVLWTFLPETKPAVVEKVLDKVLPTPGTATAGLGSFGRYRRSRRRR